MIACDMYPYYLIVWCEDIGEWHQADQCEAEKLRDAENIFRCAHPRVWKASLWAVVSQPDLEEALCRRPTGRFG